MVPQKPNSEKIKMKKKQSIKDLYKDERVRDAANDSVLYGLDQILSRATQYEDPWMIEHIMKIFQKKISPFYSKKKGYDLAGFWDEISGLFKYEFRELEKHCLNEPDAAGAVHFMGKLHRRHMDKFYPDPKDLNHTMVDLFSMITEIDDQVISEERSGK